MQAQSFSVVLPISPKTFGGSDDSMYRQNIKDIILSKTGTWSKEPIEKPLVFLRFGLLPHRLRGGIRNPKNDLDNLAKLVLDALSLEVKAKSRGTVWKGLGVITDDCDIMRMYLMKCPTQSEYVKISVFPHEQIEEFNRIVSSESLE